MKKRLLCLFLCAVMLLSAVLTGCSQKEDEDTKKDDISNDASASAMTLSMWIVSEEEVSDAVASAVTLKLNEITESKFKTRLVITYLTEDEYRAELEREIVAYEEAKKESAATETETTLPEGETAGEEVITDETETNEIGMTVIKYPELLKHQVDIIYITGEDMYVDFIEADWLAPLDSELENASKKINEYVSATLLNSAKHNGTTYAIPNNHAIGQYTYMLLNKSLMTKYSQQGYVKTGKITSFYSDELQSFLSLVTKLEDPEKVVAIDNKVYDAANPEHEAEAFDYCLDLLAHYWSINPDSYDMLQEFSVLGHLYQTNEEISRGSTVLGFESLFENVDFTEDYLRLNKFRYNKYFGSASGKTAALKFMTGDYSVQTRFDAAGDCVYVVDGVEYYPVVVEYPTATSADIYDNMFGVYKGTKSVARSMEIVTYLNTNSDFRNLLQYGIEGTHYELEKQPDGSTAVKRINNGNGYVMDIFATGNVFIAYPEPDMSANIWETGKAQNRYSLVDPLLGLDFSEYSATTGAAAMAETVNSKNGYNLTFSTGYSKDVLSQNAALASWLEACDQAGTGIYVYQSSEVVSQTQSYVYYIYRNGLTKSTNFEVVVDRELTTEDIDGEQVTTQTKLDFILTYTDGEEAAEKDYELSTMRIFTRRTNTFRVLGSVNGAEAKPEAVTLEAPAENYLNFDFYHTEEYDIEVYDSLTKAALIKNKTLTNWIALCDKSTPNGTDPTSFVLNYKNPDTGVITYVIYRTCLKDVTAQKLLPTGDSGELMLNLHYTFEPGYNLLVEERDYLLSYIRVTPAEGVTLDVDYKLLNNGVEIDVPAKNILDNEDGITDPDFDMVGNLDTELVKYLATLNEKVSALLASCEDYETFEAVVRELSILLSTNEKTPIQAPNDYQYIRTLLIDMGLITTDALKELRSNLQSAASHEVIKVMVDSKEEVDDDGNPVKVEGLYKDSKGREEAYVYFDSPYGVYYSWMSKYGYLPKADK
ncbi:MAG: hypothetical protein IKA05_02425 [Clostridia bacterium]|nr:hypothetical protein [Clostridia bacterium]